MTSPLVRIDDSSGIRTLTLNRPGGHNTVGPDLLDALRDALIVARDDVAVRVLVVTGAGDMFSAGGKIDALRDGLAGRDVMAERAALRHAAETIAMLREFPAPTLARINGAAAGGGLAISLACDIRIARDDAKLAYAYARIGLAGDLGVNWLLTRLLGSARARSVAFAAAIAAPEALAMGLIDASVPAAAFDDYVDRTARRLAAIPRAAAQAIKRNLDCAAALGFEEAAAQEASSFQMLRETPEHAAAIAAWLARSDAT